MFWTIRFVFEGFIHSIVLNLFPNGRSGIRTRERYISKYGFGVLVLGSCSDH